MRAADNGLQHTVKSREIPGYFTKNKPAEMTQTRLNQKNLMSVPS